MKLKIIIFSISLLLMGCMNSKTIKEYFIDGSLKSESNYINGKLNGVKTVYFNNGGIDWRADYVNNKIHGNFNEYYENGSIKTIAKYYNGILNGHLLHYFSSDGREKAFYEYKKGKKEGFSKHYENNKLIAEFLFHCDTVIYSKRFNKSGVSREYHAIIINSISNDTISIIDTFKVNISLAGKVVNKDFELTGFIEDEALSIKVFGQNNANGYYDFQTKKIGMHKFIAAVKYSDSDTSTIFIKYFCVN